MTVREIQNILSAEVVCGGDCLDREVNDACGSDMMSDVLAFVKQQAVLLTGLVNPQVIRTAEMMDMKCVVFVRGKRPDRDMTELAEILILYCLQQSSLCFRHAACCMKKDLAEVRRNERYHASL